MLLHTIKISSVLVHKLFKVTCYSKLESVESQVWKNKTHFGRYLTVMFEVLLPAIIDSKVYIKVFKGLVPKN